MAEIFGIDVAKWQGIIDWNKVNVSFAILKVTKQNNATEDAFERNYIGATKSGIKVGGYRYVYAKNEEEAKAEAEAIVRACKDKILPYGIWLDMEDKSIKGLGKAKLASIIRTEATIIQAAGHKVGIYCNKDWYENVLDGRYLSNEYQFWIARYPLMDRGIYNAKSKLNPKSYAVAWQYSSKGKVPGVTGNVDMDVYFDGVEEKCPYRKPIVPVTSDAVAKEYKRTHKKPLTYVSSGEAVGWVQWHLQRLGYNIGKKGVDLKCGKDTVASIIKFQADHQLVEDAIAGINTNDLLDK